MKERHFLRATETTNLFGHLQMLMSVLDGCFSIGVMTRSGPRSRSRGSVSVQSHSQETVLNGGSAGSPRIIIGDENFSRGTLHDLGRIRGRRRRFDYGPVSGFRQIMLRASADDFLVSVVGWMLLLLLLLLFAFVLECLAKLELFIGYVASSRGGGGI